MSSAIWTRCAGDAERRPLRITAWRVVEAQHEVSTRKLVDSADEQALLETLIERVKPPAVGSARQHYLLTTPFRHPPLSASLMAFTVRARSGNGVDLVAPPFAAFRDAIASPVSYTEAQALGAAMHAAGVEWFRYPSARDAGGVNVGAFTPAVFGRAVPQQLQRWHAVATTEVVEFTRRDLRRAPGCVRVPREALLVDGELPRPAV
jgi:hypothetical protein